MEIVIRIKIREDFATNKEEVLACAEEIKDYIYDKNEDVVDYVIYEIVSLGS